LIIRDWVSILRCRDYFKKHYGKKQMVRSNQAKSKNFGSAIKVISEYRENYAVKPVSLSH
ncbi:MAG TPA: hypothetical protein VFV79_05955, partial [Saprospiraceae bacterium]|nr:hypothetical protein [Saprospiraceae bacterium]